MSHSTNSNYQGKLIYKVGILITYIYVYIYMEIFTVYLANYNEK